MKQLQISPVLDETMKSTILPMLCESERYHTPMLDEMMKR